MVGSTSRTAQSVSTPHLRDQKLEAMRKLASSMREEIRTLAQAVQINIRANPDWAKVANKIASMGNRDRLTRDLTANAERFKKELQGRFGIENPSRETEGFCKAILPRLLVWQKIAHQLLKK